MPAKTKSRSTVATPPDFRRAERLRPRRVGPTTSQLTDRHHEILAQIETIISNEGFARLTVGEFAARLKCSRSTLYEIAPSKDELVLVVLDRALRRIGRAAAERIRTLDDPAEQIEAFMAIGPSELRRTTLPFSEDVARHPAARRLFADHFRHATAILEELIDEGMRRGRFRSLQSRIVAEVIDASLARLQDPTILRETGLTFEQAVTELSELVRGGLLGRT